MEHSNKVITAIKLKHSSPRQFTKMGNALGQIDVNSIAELGNLAVKAYNSDSTFNKMISSLASPPMCPMARDREDVPSFMRCSILASQRELWITIGFIGLLALIMAIMIGRHCFKKASSRLAGCEFFGVSQRNFQVLSVGAAAAMDRIGRDLEAGDAREQNPFV